MHIENVHIHLSPGSGLTELAKAMGFGAVVTAPEHRKIGDRWPGVEGVYAGIARADGAMGQGHIVLLDAKPPGDLTWDAAMKWAEGLGDGARLPTRWESGLLYANLQDQFETDRWHWTGTQCSDSRAWFQYFSNGYQSDNGKTAEARARAVRRF